MVGDIDAFGEQVFFHPDLGSTTKWAAVKAFPGQFRSGEVVTLVFSSSKPTAE